MSETSFKEKRIRNITNLYYSKSEIQRALFDFSANREISPRYFEGFGKRPDSFQYPGDVFEMVKKGATSFHCSEEIWDDPLKVVTGMNEKQLNEIRRGWDLLIDIDSKYIDYSKIMAQIIIQMLNFHGVKSIGVKFSGSKGFHIVVPWKAFPKEVNGLQTKDMFPEYPRIIMKYLTEKTQDQLVERISELERPNKYIKDHQAPKEVIPDLIAVSPRHLFRMPYSLHEKTSLASIPLSMEELENFQPKDADPLKAKIKPFYPEPKEGEASELLMQALDWYRENGGDDEEKKSYDSEFKVVKLTNLSEEHFPPSVKKILKGVGDGKKRALFVLINLFRSIGMEREELEKRVYDWNEKNEIPLKKGYIKSQLSWTYRHKIVLPPNFNKDYYKAIGANPTPEELAAKNPVNYIVRKNRLSNRSRKSSNKFKKKN